MLKRLVKADAESARTRTVPRVWIFDVDGVITNPALKRVTSDGLIEAIARRFEKGEYVALNTGRSAAWMMERVIKQIKDAVDDEADLAKFLAVGEKGGVLVSFEDGKWVYRVDPSISVPEPLKAEVRKLIADEFGDSMFYDGTKQTMISTEMIDGNPIPEYAKEQKVLVSRFERILARPEYRDLGLKVDPTTIATDIQNPRVGKHLGARKVADWLEENAVSAQSILEVGDSQSDTEMAEELQDNYPVRFIFVGDPSKLDTGRLKDKPTFTSKRFDEGTLEFLNST